MTKRILIGTPICEEKISTIEEYIDSVKCLCADIMIIENGDIGHVPKYKQMFESKGFKYDHLTAKTVMDRVVLSRQKIVDYAKEKGYSHVLFIDSDVIITKEQFTKFMSTQRDIISGVCLTIDSMGFPIPVPKISDSEHMPLDHFNTGIRRYYKIGFGCVMIKVNVFKFINIRYERTRTGKLYKSEDYCFSEDAIRLGFDLFVDTDMQVKHIMTCFIDWDKS